MADKGRILVVDDDKDVRDTIREYFEFCGFDVSVAGDGDGMRKVLASRPIEIVLMDLNLPGEDGLALTRDLRASHPVGVIMLTAAGQTIDRIIGLEMGADDYVPKPFDPRELLARVKSVLRRFASDRRRSPTSGEAKPEIVRMGSCTLDLAAHRLYDASGADIPLTSMEFDLLQAFAKHPDRVLSREQLSGACSQPGCRRVRPQHRFAHRQDQEEDRTGRDQAAGAEDRAGRRLHVRQQSQAVASLSRNN